MLHILCGFFIQNTPNYSPNERRNQMTRMDYTPERTATQKNMFDEAMMVLHAYGMCIAHIK